MMMRPLDLPERDLVRLLVQGIRDGVPCAGCPSATTSGRRKMGGSTCN